MIIFDDLSQVFQFAPVNTFVFPGQFVAGGNRCGRSVVLEKFFLNLVCNPCAQVNTHRTLTGSQFV